MKTLNINPLADRVVVKVLEAETQTKSGIIIPDSAKEKPLEGVIMAVGKGTEDEPMEVKIGDQVIFGKFGGTEIEVEGEKYLIMRQNEIFGICE